MAPSEPRFPLSEIKMALIFAGIGSAERERILKELLKRRRRGRKEESGDGPLISRALDLVDEEKGVSVNAAAAIVALDFPDSQREAARKRIARKTKKLLKQANDEINEAASQAIKKRATKKAELEYLRSLFLPKKN